MRDGVTSMITIAITLIVIDTRMFIYSGTIAITLSDRDQNVNLGRAKGLVKLASYNERLLISRFFFIYFTNTAKRKSFVKPRTSLYRVRYIFHCTYSILIKHIAIGGFNETHTCVSTRKFFTISLNQVKDSFI